MKKFWLSALALLISTAALGQSIGPAPGGGSSVSWPPSGGIVVSNGTNSPSGITPSSTGCLVANGTVWSLGSCSGSGGISGPGTTVSGYVPLWNSTNGSTVGAGLPVGTTGNSTIIESNGSGYLVTGIMPALTGDVTSTAGGVATTVGKINGVSLGGLSTGLLKNTTSTGVPSIAAAGTDYVAPGGALGTPSSGTATNLTGLPLSTGVTGTLPTANGGTGQTSFPPLTPSNQALFNNGTPFYLPHWCAALGRVKSGNGNATIVYVGDSTTYGVGSNGNTSSGPWNALSYPSQLAGMFNAALINAHANGFAGFSASPQTRDVDDGRFTASGTFTYLTPLSTYPQLGGEIDSLPSATAALAFKPNANVDTFKVWYLINTGQGTAYYNIDGGSNTNVSTAGSQSIGTFAATAAAPGIHTLNVGRVSGAEYGFPLAVDAYNSTISSIHMINTGWSAATSGNLSTMGQNYNPLNMLQTQFSQDLTIIFSGINDWDNSVSLPTYSTNIQALITAAKAAGGDVILISPPPSNPGTDGAPANSVQATYVATLASLANSNNIPYLDFFDLWQSYAVSSAYNLYADGLHPNGTGYSGLTLALFNLLNPGTGANVIPVYANNPNSTFSGTTAGSISYSEPVQGSNYKLFNAYAAGYENDTATNQTITFPVPFTNTPSISVNGTGLTASATTTTLTITAPNNTTAYSGNLQVTGQ